MAKANPRYVGIVLGGHLTNSTTTLLLQTRDPVLKDVRIRRALALAIDVDQLVKVVTGDAAPANASIVPKTSAYYGAVQREGHKTDVERARALLKEAGYAGAPIKLMTNKRYGDMYNAALIAQAMARQAGLNLELEVLEWGAQLERYTARVYTAVELDAAHRSAAPVAQSLAARFAAKEAVLKALRTGDRPVDLREIEIVRADDGAPAVVLHGALAGVAQAAKIATMDVSLSHVDTYATATVVALCDGDTQDESAQPGPARTTEER